MPKKRDRVERKFTIGPVSIYGKKKPKKKMKRVNPRKAGSYLTTKGQKKRIIDEQTSYYME